MPDHQAALSVLKGLRLLEIWRSLDMLVMHFGEWREVTSRRAGTRQVGDWALHIQTSWRFTRSARILVGVLDFYQYADEDLAYNWDKGGESRFDRLADGLNQTFKEGEITVREVACDEVGTISLSLDGGLRFDVFPNFSSDYPNREYWRLLQPGTEHPQYVLCTDGTPPN